MDVEPGGDLGGGQGGIPPSQPDDGVSGAGAGAGLNPAPSPWLVAVLALVAGAAVGVVEDERQLSLIASIVVAVIVGIAVGLLGRLVVWGWRERAIRRAADRVLRARGARPWNGQGA